MTAETSNARWEVVAERQAWYEQQIALAEGQWAAAFLDRWECGDDVPSKEHYVALWLAERADPQPADARVGVRGLVALAEQMERDAAGCRRDGYTDAAVVKEDCAQRIRQTLGISAIAEALAAEGVQPEPKPVLSEPDRIGLYQGPDDCPQLMVNDRPVAIFPAGSWAKVCDALDSITGSVQPEPKAEARGVVDEGSRAVTNQLLHWGGIPVRVTGTVTTSPGNWPLIDATQHQEPKS